MAQAKLPKADYTIEPRVAYWPKQGMQAGFNSRREAILHLVGERAACRVALAQGNIAGAQYGMISACVTACMEEIVEELEAAGWFVIPAPRDLG